MHTTPDGQQLSGWWRRVFARIIDSIIVGIIGLPLTGYFYYQYVLVIWQYLEDTMDAAAAGTPTTTTALPPEAYKWMVPAVLIGMVVSFVYEYLFLTKKGATPGKMALGIAVRLRDVPGLPPGQAVAKRYGFEIALGVLGAIPLIGTLFGFLALINYLWPLWDDKKQALHDKIAGTNVVRT
ncbi:RDD family protein [Kribbella turkmenica]|uniref:RDD family protein n=1 Tax=Kribbella turkmenica TaxID=2530375 RepID=UPI001F2E8D63|nr:RDD family protein [Kribbella turkmenica]